jgi:hypothetical protein
MLGIFYLPGLYYNLQWPDIQSFNILIVNNLVILLRIAGSGPGGLLLLFLSPLSNLVWRHRKCEKLCNSLGRDTRARRTIPRQNQGIDVDW